MSEIVKDNSEPLPSTNYLCDICKKTTHPTKSHKSLGGARANAGRAKGSENESTKLLRKAKQEFNKRVIKMADRLINAQLQLALGETNLYVTRTRKDGSRKTEVVDDPKIIQAYLENTLEWDKNTTYYYIASKPPSNKAIDSLFNRAMGKPQESVDVTSGGSPIPILGGASVSSDNSDEQTSQTQEKD